jgi:hypothetical protein
MFCVVRMSMVVMFLFLVLLVGGFGILERGALVVGMVVVAIRQTNED